MKKLAVFCGRRKYYPQMRNMIKNVEHHKVMMPIVTCYIPKFMKIIIHAFKIMISKRVYIVTPYGDDTAREVRIANYFKKEIVKIKATQLERGHL